CSSPLPPPPAFSTLSLHDALPIFLSMALLMNGPHFAWADDPLAQRIDALVQAKPKGKAFSPRADDAEFVRRAYLDFALGLGLHRSEEHTSELQSRRDLVCRLLLEK